MNKLLAAGLACVQLAGLGATAAWAGWNLLKSESAETKKASSQEVAQAIPNFKNKDPSMNVFFEKAYGYAVFPTVGKGWSHVRSERRRAEAQLHFQVG